MVDSPEKIRQLAENYKADVMLVLLGDRSEAIQQTIEKTFAGKNYFWINFLPTDPDIPEGCLCIDPAIGKTSYTSDLTSRGSLEQVSSPFSPHCSIHSIISD